VTQFPIFKREFYLPPGALKYKAGDLLLFIFYFTPEAETIQFETDTNIGIINTLKYHTCSNSGTLERIISTLNTRFYLKCNTLFSLVMRA